MYVQFCKKKHGFRLMVRGQSQSHYIEVAQGRAGSVEQDTISCEYLARFQPKEILKKLRKTKNIYTVFP